RPPRPHLSPYTTLFRSLAASPPAQATPPVAPRRFDDDALATFTTASNTLQCECPRHLADVLMMIGSFERYSAQCANRNQADAQLDRKSTRLNSSHVSSS